VSKIKSPGAVAALGALGTDGLARHVVNENRPHKFCPQGPLYAKLIRCSAPVLALCRRLIEAGHEPERSLYAYRGAVLVRSIGEAARLRIATHGVGFEPLPECTQKAQAAAGLGAGDGDVHKGPAT
jgi:hypothetical protein